MRQSKINLNNVEVDAIAAALRLLGNKLEMREIEPNDGDIGDILTGTSEHYGLDAEQIHALCDRLLQQRP